MIEIAVGGSIYGGWTTARIERGIEQIAGSFDLSVTDRWPGQDTQRQIICGDACQVLIDDEPVITGYVDDSSPQFDSESHGISVNGRDATGDLVDCAAIHKSGQWSNSTLDKIVRDICAPFKIKVKRENAPVGDVFASFAIQEGESAFECIERACRMRAVLPVSDGLGSLVLTRANSAAPVAELIEGVNILGGSGQFTLKERFSRYIIKGQDRGDDYNDASTWSQVMAESIDSRVTRYRPLIVIAEEHGPNATYRQRAEWERNVRRGRSARATITVQGWRNGLDQLWQPNTMVHLVSSSLAADIDLLIVKVVYMLDENGQRTELHLAGREAFDLIAGVKGTKLNKALHGKYGAGKSDPQKKKNQEDWGML